MEETNPEQQNGTVIGPFNNLPNAKRFFKLEVSRRARTLMVVPAVLTVAALGFWFFYEQHYGYGLDTLSNGGSVYSLRFTKSASKEIIQGSQYLVGYSLKDFKRVAVVIKPTDDLTSLNCSDLGANWKMAFYEQKVGAPYPVCTQNDREYEMIFSSGDHNQLAEVISEDGTSSINTETVNTVFGSLVVSK